MKVKTFIRDEDGAVTVDWVVMTAVVVGLAILLLGLIETAALDEVSTWFT